MWIKQFKSALYSVGEELKEISKQQEIKLPKLLTFLKYFVHKISVKFCSDWLLLQTPFFYLFSLYFSSSWSFPFENQQTKMLWELEYLKAIENDDIFFCQNINWRSQHKSTAYKHTMQAKGIFWRSTGLNDLCVLPSVKIVKLKKGKKTKNNNNARSRQN